MANLLVTGGAGFIGGNFAHYWNAHHPDDAVIVLDALTYAGNRSTLDGAPRTELVEGDIRDTETVETSAISAQSCTLPQKATWTVRSAGQTPLSTPIFWAPIHC